MGATDPEESRGGNDSRGFRRLHRRQRRPRLRWTGDGPGRDRLLLSGARHPRPVTFARGQSFLRARHEEPARDQPSRPRHLGSRDALRRTGREAVSREAGVALGAPALRRQRRRDDRPVEAAAREARRRARRFALPPSSATRPPPTARASGCSTSAAATRSKRSTSRRTIAARCASRRRRAARSTARSARPASRASTAISPTAEIVGQLWHANRALIADGVAAPWVAQGRSPITNVVMMGMGEPLANFDAVVTALSLFLDDNAYGLSRRRVTLSTSGLVPAIDRLAAACPVALAVSLHAPDDALRDVLVPINRKYPIADAPRRLQALSAPRAARLRHVRIRDARRRQRRSRSRREPSRSSCATSRASST